ncbi:hypothetical protein [uncultured Nitrosomonas sp.]|uniref:hypothetical protein n=1 Tax=uncultured Nitrosomonas sp. TaxID=156424 RepID=UPI0026216C89|nr:hypothetical protein [uncultured Nitrosomonas sp.]
MAAIYDTLSEQKLNGKKFDDIQPDSIHPQVSYKSGNLLLLVIVVPVTDNPYLASISGIES